MDFYVICYFQTYRNVAENRDLPYSFQQTFLVTSYITIVESSIPKININEILLNYATKLNQILLGFPLMSIFLLQDPTLHLVIISPEVSVLPSASSERKKCNLLDF